MSRKVVRRYEHGRIAYYAESVGPGFWAQHWQKNLRETLYERAEAGCLGFFETPFVSHLPKTGRILDGGCGLGQHVLALRSRGYDVEGIECEKQVVQDVRSLRTDLPIRYGDATSLGVAGGYYAGYISLGVVEHRREGPEIFLREARRVLKNDGVLLLSVPWIHSLRRLKAILGLYNGDIQGLDFYAYAFSISEMKALLKSHGFVHRRLFMYGGYKGLKDEIPLVKPLTRKRGGWRLERWLHSSRLVARCFGHMVMFICTKAASSPAE